MPTANAYAKAGYPLFDYLVVAFLICLPPIFIPTFRLIKIIFLDLLFYLYRECEIINRANMHAAPTIKNIISEVLTLLFNSENNDAIEKALEILIRFFNADWVYVALFENEHKVANFIYEVTSPWVHTSKEDASELSYETIPWMIDTIIQGKDIILHDINDLPDHAHADRELFKEQGLLSMLVIPLTFHGEIRGFIGFDSIRVRRHWTLAEVEDLHLIANIFSIIIERQYAQKSIKESRKNLLQSNMRFQMIFRNLPVGVELYDAEGILIDTNEASASIFGTNREELIGINVFENPNMNYLAQSIGRGRNTDLAVAYHFNKVRESGYYRTSFVDTVKYLQVKSLILKDEEGDKLGYLFIISDNTENYMKAEMELKLRKAEEEQRRTEMEMQKVREADKLKSAFLANMSHEIRTPLNAIVGFSSIMSETDDPEERTLYQEIINKNNELLLQLVSDILDFSKIESGVLHYKKSEVNLKEVCSEIYVTYKTNDATQVPLIFKADELPEVTVYTDAKRITQVITNLLSNAFKFTTEGSVRLSYDLHDNHVRVAVKDTGIGIAPEHCPRVFDRFMKVDNFSQGTGLGLPICKTIIGALGGEIGLRSQWGKGSTFWFTLPLSMPEA